MQSLNVRSLLAFILLGSLALTAAENPAIGLVTAKGTIRVDNSPVWNSATLLDGTAIETARVASQLHLNSGARLKLAAQSRAKVYRHRLVLERGAGELTSATSYSIEARGLMVSTAAPEAAARVGFDKDRRVLVAALNGPVRVAAQKGVLVANLSAGRMLVLDPQQAGAAPLMKLTGRLERRDGHFLLTDETSNVSFELVGEGLENEVGNRIEVSGVLDPAAKPFAPATQLVKITKLARLPAALPPGGWAGLSAGAKTAIVAGVGVGAALGTMGLAGVFEEEEKKPVSP